MHPQIILVTGLFMSAVLCSPLYNPPLNGESKLPESQMSLQGNGNPLEVNDAATKSSANSATEAKDKDLMGQETFYPVGGVWWGVRPWGGWGGYRPWHGWNGWHGWHGWHRPPHWGGHWGGHWGRPWGGQWGGGRST